MKPIKPAKPTIEVGGLLQNNPWQSLMTVAKAVAAGTVAGLGVIVQELAQDGSLNTQEIISAVIAFIIGTGIVYWVPNRKP